MGKTKILIDYQRCGEEGMVDPRECSKCMKVCEPSVFLMHQTLGKEYLEKNPLDPQFWRITPLYPSQCTHCFKCISSCPERAISIYYKNNFLSNYRRIGN